MSGKPVHLATSLTTVLGYVFYTFGAVISWNERLIKFFAFRTSFCFSVVLRWIVDAGLILFPDCLEGAFVIFALAWMDHFVIWCPWDLNIMNSTDIHIFRIIKACSCHITFAHVDSTFICHLLRIKLFCLIVCLHI